MCNLSDMLVEENLEKGVKATKMILAGKSDEGEYPKVCVNLQTDVR